MKTYFTYILLSQKDDGYYFGFTENLQKRLNYHNKGQVKSTCRRTPFVIQYFEQFNSRAEAMQGEKFFKSFEGRKWLIANKIISQKK